MCARFNRKARIETLQRVLMTGDVVETRDADALTEMLRKLRADAATPVEIAPAGISEIHGSTDVGGTAEARALHAAMEANR